MQTNQCVWNCDLPAAIKTEQIQQNEGKQTIVFETEMKAAAVNVGNTTN